MRTAKNCSKMFLVGPCGQLKTAQNVCGRAMRTAKNRSKMFLVGPFLQLKTLFAENRNEKEQKRTKDSRIDRTIGRPHQYRYVIKSLFSQFFLASPSTNLKPLSHATRRRFQKRTANGEPANGEWRTANSERRLANDERRTAR